MRPLPVGDDARNPNPASVLLVGEVGGRQHAVGHQSVTQRRQRRAVGGYSGEVQVGCLLLATSHGRQGRGDGADSSARKRGLEPCTSFLVGDTAALTVLIGQDAGCPQGPTALHPQAVQGP